MRTNFIIKKTFYICKNQFKDTIKPLTTVCWKTPIFQSKQPTTK